VTPIELSFRNDTLVCDLCRLHERLLHSNVYDFASLKVMLVDCLFALWLFVFVLNIICAAIAIKKLQTMLVGFGLPINTKPCLVK
jgi:hypothetical protein